MFIEIMLVVVAVLLFMIFWAVRVSSDNDILRGQRHSSERSEIILLLRGMQVRQDETTEAVNTHIDVAHPTSKQRRNRR